MSKQMRITGYAPLVVLLIVVTLLIYGCGGGGPCAGEGCVHGFIYVPGGGGDLIVSASPQPPDGYQPCAGALVYIEDTAQLSDYTDARGYYVIWGIPPGVQTVVAEGCDSEVRFSVIVVGGRCTLGSGHTEGGGGVG